MSQLKSEMNEYVGQYLPDIETLRLAIHNAKIHQQIIQQYIENLSPEAQKARLIQIQKRKEELREIFHPK